MLKKPLLKAFLIEALIINIIMFFFGITLYAVHPAVTFGSSNYLVVWQDYRNSSWDIYGARVDQSGNVLDTLGFAISTALGGEYSPSIAFDGINYLVVWSNTGGGIYGARVDQLGVVIDTTEIKIIDGYSAHTPSVAFDGTNYLVVCENHEGSSYNIRGARVNTSGDLIDSSGIAIATDPFDQYSPAVAFSDSNYLVVWHSGNIYGARVDQSGNVLDTAGINISTDTNGQAWPSISFNGINYLVVWQDLRNGNHDIYGARVDQSGNVLDTAGFAISIDTNRQRFASVAFGETNSLVVWEDYRNVYPDIYGARVDQSGGVLDTTGITISTAVDSQYSPSVAFDGTNYLTVWHKRSGIYYIYDIYGTRVDQSGNVLDTAGIYISTSSTGIKEENDIIPDYFFLSQNHPNPFMSRTKISFTLPKASRVNLKVYDITGRLVATLIDEWRNAGRYTVTWDVRNERGNKVPSGFYFLRLEAGEYKGTRKLLLIR